MKAILVNYNHTPTWLKGYDLDYIIADRSDSKEFLKDFPQERIAYTENKGNVDYDKLTYLVERYYDLPDIFLWGKSNIFKYIDEPSFNTLLDKKEFTPLLRQDHNTYSDSIGTVCYYENGMYYERNDSWYLNTQPAKHFNSWANWAKEFQLPNPIYLPFAPGGNYLLTKETVHKYSRDFYDKMRNTMPYTILPGEAQLAERSYYLMWK